jgi:hypothetical protein
MEYRVIGAAGDGEAFSMNRPSITLVVATFSLFACGKSVSFAQDISSSIDPLAPAREGSLLCIRPKADKKGCNTLLRYDFRDGGIIRVQADVTMSETVVMSLNFEAIIKSGAVCSVGREEDVRAATFMIGGRPASAEETGSLRGYLANNIRTLPVSEACLNFVATTQGFMVETSIGGIRHAEMDEPMIWVSPTDGYIAVP